MDIKDIYLFSATHWDREWYQTFQGFRFRLVKMVDELIEYMEKEEEYGVFHFDGQTIVLEDYAQIAPENIDRLKKLIGEGRIKIGPWYNMPDEFLLSGESLIRNLMVGSRLCEEWGVRAWNFGYVCDIFGHIAQMPQIFNGFNIQYSIVGRGTNEEDTAYFDWQSPDGSSCISFRLKPSNGYCAFSAEVVNEGRGQDTQTLKNLIRKHVEEERSRSDLPVVILMDASDHQRVNQQTPHLLKLIEELYPTAQVHHCDLTLAGEQLRKEGATLPVTVGELSKTAIHRHSYLHLITNTLSSYYTHKQANDECQNLLEKIIEPLMVQAALNGQTPRRAYVDLAYRYLLKNHPHDSICGCSVAQVHKDMIYRFDQVKEISSVLIEEYLYDNRPEPGDSGAYILRLYNTLPFERHEVVTVDFILKTDFPKYSEPLDYEEIDSFKIVDTMGAEIAYELVEMRKNAQKRACALQIERGTHYKVSFLAKIPSFGFCEYRIVPQEKPSRYLEKMSFLGDSAENEYIRLDIRQNGEISIYDKNTKKTYDHLLGLVDDGEIGDGWFHANPVNDSVVYSSNCDIRVEKIKNGPTKCVFRITRHIDIPKCMEHLISGERRSESYIRIPVAVEVGLSAHARFVEVKMDIDNCARDHRLRLALPTGTQGQTYFSGQAYYCNERKCRIDYKTQDWREHEQYEKQMNGIVGKRNADGHGLAFVSAAGLHECAAIEDTLYITLLRAFSRTFTTMGEEEGQLLGNLSYHFLLAPLDPGIGYSDLIRLQDCLAVAPLHTCTQAKTEEAALRATSMMRLEGENICLSIIKQPEEAQEKSIIVRVFNASPENAEGKLVFDRRIQNVCAVNLNEEFTVEQHAVGNEINFALSPWKINTYKIQF